MSKHFPTFVKIYQRLKKVSFKNFKLKIMFKVIFVVIILSATGIIIKDQIEYTFGLGFWSEDGLFSEATNGDDYEDEYVYQCAEDNNVRGLYIQGSLLTYIPDPYYNDPTLAEDSLTASEDVVYYIEQADKDEQIKAILLEIDCFGGSGTAAREIVKALDKAAKPTVALIREFGASACYWAALGADVIFADTTSNVGSIGVTMSYLESAGKNREEGFVYQEISSGRFKDSGSPDKELTAEEKSLFQRDVDILHDIFVNDVATYRDLDIAKVKSLADGSSLLGEAALDNGLIDKLGDRYDVDDYLREKLGEEVSVCW